MIFGLQIPRAARAALFLCFMLRSVMSAQLSLQQSSFLVHMLRFPPQAGGGVEQVKSDPQVWPSSQHPLAHTGP